MRKILAEIISFIFGAPWILIIGWAVLFHSGLDKSQIKFMVMAALILYLLLPGIYFVYAMRKGFIEDIDITKRQQRYTIMSIYLMAHLLILIMSFVHGTSAMVEKIAIVTAVYFTIYIITFFWKISLHMALNMMGITFINMSFGWHYKWLYLLIPLVTWSRLALKKHTINQLLAGGIIPFIEIAIIRFFSVKMVLFK